MATYKEIFGKKIQSLASDIPAAQGEGQIWYNETSDTFKTSVITSAWASGGAVNTARRQGSGAGTQTAALLYAGYGPAFSNALEEYNGSSWTTATAGPFSVYNAAGGGTQTAYVATGGDLGPAINTVTAEWNGASWSTESAFPAAKNGASGAGTQTALVSTGGSPAPTVATYYYNGTSWSDQSASLNTARYENTNSSCGTQTAALLVGGEVPPFVANVEEWNGTAWSDQNAIPTATRQIATSGIQTSALAYGGEVPGPAVTAVTLAYDGTTWSTSTSMATARRGPGGLGEGALSTAALASSGHDGSANTDATEEFTVAAAVKTVTTS